MPNLDLFYYYLKSVRRYPAQMLLVSALTMLFGWMLVISLPDKYEAISRLNVTTESVTQGLLEGLAPSARLEQESASLMRRTLLNRPNLEALVEQPELHFNYQDQRDKEALIRDLRTRIRVDGSIKTGIYTIRYSDVSPQHAHDVVQALTDIFVRNSRALAQQDSVVTKEVVDRELQKYEALIRRQKDKLDEYKRSHVADLPTTGGNYFVQLSDSQEDLRKARLALQEAQQRLEALAQQRDSLRPRRVRKLSKTEKELQTLEAQLSDLRLKFTDAHPDIRDLQQRIAALKALQAGAGSASYVTPANANTSQLRSIEVELGRARGEVEALKVRVQAYESQVSFLKQQMGVRPSIESELEKMNQEYEVLQNTYDALLTKKEAAMLTNEVHQDTSPLKVRVIEYPVVSALPVQPNRLKWLLLVTVMGLVGGIAWTTLRAQREQKIVTPRDLKALTGLPVIGAVSLFITRPALAKRRRERTLLTLGWVMLAVVFVALVMVYGLDMSLAKLMGTFV